MKKSALFVLALLIIAVLLSSCAASFPSKEKAVSLTADGEAAEFLKDKTEKDIHDNRGAPDEMFSGFYGDIYFYNNKCIGIYYDSDSRVTEVVVFDRQN